MNWLNKIFVLFLITFVINQREEINAARILGIFPLPVRSHFIMSETLMKGLASRGHQVDVVSPFPLKNPPPNYHDIIRLNDILPTTVNNLTIEEGKKYTGAGIAQIFGTGGTTFCNVLSAPQIQNLIKKPPNDPPYDLVINEQMLADCFMGFGRHLKVPMVGIVTNKIYDWMNLPMGNSESTAFVPSIFSDFTQKMNFFERLKNTITINYIKFYYWVYHAPSQLSEIKKHFGLKIDDISELWNDIAILLVNSHHSFDFVRPLNPRIIEVGGLHVNDGDQDLSPSVNKWLDESKDGCIYVSFGSMIKIESFPVETIESFYQTFEKISPVRILMKIAKKEELPPGLPRNVMTSPWLPQTRVLQHKNVKLFVTHAGLMSTQEAVTYGVPMLGFPLFADQYLNSRLCEQKNIMMTMDYKNMNAESLSKTINILLENSSYSKNSKQLAKLYKDRPMSPLNTAIFWIEYVLRNGNVLESPSNQLSWWKLELLDLYGFLLIIITIFVLCLIKFFKLLFRLLILKFNGNHDKSKTKNVTGVKKNQ